MSGYIMNFAIYLMAMLGFIVLAVFVYKKSLNFNSIKGSKEFLSVENALRLSASKTIYVIKAGEEKFLIASDAATTTMLSKLNNDETFNYSKVNSSCEQNIKMHAVSEVSGNYKQNSLNNMQKNTILKKISRG